MKTMLKVALATAMMIGAGQTANAAVASIVSNRTIIDNRPLYSIGAADSTGSVNYALNDPTFIDIPYVTFRVNGTTAGSTATLNWDFDSLFSSPPASITLYVGSDADGNVTTGDRFMGTAINTFTYSDATARAYDVTSYVNTALANGEFFAARLEANVVPAAGYYGGLFRAPSLTFATATPAVPEPATWAMMLMGFGGIGFAMRRRKSKVTTNAAYA